MGQILIRKSLFLFVSVFLVIGSLFSFSQAQVLGQYGPSSPFGGDWGLTVEPDCPFGSGCLPIGKDPFGGDLRWIVEPDCPFGSGCLPIEKHPVCFGYDCPPPDPFCELIPWACSPPPPPPSFCLIYPWLCE